MSINQSIPQHSKPLFNFEDVKTAHNEKYIKSYYHELSDFLPLHTHAFYEINIISSGAGKHRFGDKEILTRKGDIFIIPPHTRHGYSCNEKLKVYHILLSELFVATFSRLLKNMKGYDLLFNYEPMLRGRINENFYLRSGDIPTDTVKTFIDLIEGCSEGDEIYEAEKLSHVLSLIAALSKAIHELKPLACDSFPDKHTLSLIESMEYIEMHFAEKIDIKDLSQRTALSYSTYLRYFKKLSGSTPTEYQNACRIKNASSRLLNTTDSIMNIGLDCGFYDSSHFIREFLRLTGLTPTEFRRDKRN